MNQAPVRPFLDFSVEDIEADIVLMGVLQSEPYPHDPCPNDQSRAPDAIRTLSKRFCYATENWDFDLGAPLIEALPPRRVDLGNLAWSDGESFDSYTAHITATARRVLESNAQLVVLGGDHGVTIPILDALDQVGKPFHVVQIDAHIDWREDVAGIRRGYSSPMRWASTKRSVTGITQLGIRAIGSARRSEVEAARAYGAQIITAEALHTRGYARAFDSIPPGSDVYLTIDADGLDPCEIPAVMAPTPGGLRFAQLAPFLRELGRRHRIVAFDLVEIAPGYDLPNAVSCITAGRLILNVLGATASAV